MSTPTDIAANNSAKSDSLNAALLLAVLGVVFGDIGTSPLYALRECFSGSHALPLDRSHVISVLSLIFWAVTLIVSVKYVLFILRADNKKEGGVLALLALALSTESVRKAGHSKWIVPFGLFGAALLYGDATITPAISVLSAVEGLEVIEPGLHSFVTYITVAILIVLFSLQSRGTDRLGRMFGPVMLIWFLTLAACGIGGILREPSVLKAVNPLYGLDLVVHGGWPAFAILGTVFLAVTGAEGLYADMGHFGRTPIRALWFCFVMPSLLLNYFGQGALLLTDAAAVDNPFYRLSPRGLMVPMLILATVSTIIASQAMISAVFSITRQASQLGYLPRTKIVHTSEEEIGQIYLPKVNWLLLAATIVLVFSFGSSSNLANAYGIAVALTMVATSVLAMMVSYYVWRWPLAVCLLISSLFLIVDLTFVAANMLKLFHGGLFPLSVGICGCLIMLSWRRGRAVLFEKLIKRQLPLLEFIDKLRESGTHRVPGTGVFLCANIGVTPPAMLTTVKHNKTLLGTAVVMTVVTENVPYVDPERRLEINELGEGIVTAVARLGFMEAPDIPRLVRAVARGVPAVDPGDTTYYLGRETLVYGRDSVLPRWQAMLFRLLSQNAESAMSFFRLPPDRVIEVGVQVQI